MKKHILICGEIGVGKSTLAGKLLALTGKPVSGFITKRLPPDDTGECPTYIHAAALPVAERFYSEMNLVGSCGSRHMTFCCPEVFDSYGVELLREKTGSIMLMDEIGFMENEAGKFQSAILERLDGKSPVLAVIKNKHTPFLDALRAHPNVGVYYLTAENREELFAELTATLTDFD